MFRLSIVLLVLAAALPACSGAPRIPGITPYKIDIQQGNFVSQEMVSQLKPGMSKEQVRLALGTPLLADMFHADRWDYVYWRVAPDGTRESRKLAVFFSDGKLIRADGDIVPLQKSADPVPPPSPVAPTPALISPTAPGAPAPAGPAPAGPEAPVNRSAVPPPQTPPAQETK